MKRPATDWEKIFAIHITDNSSRFKKRKKPHKRERKIKLNLFEMEEKYIVEQALHKMRYPIGQ